MIDIEDAITLEWETKIKTVEEDMVDKLESDPGLFYRYAQSKSMVQSDIIPLRHKCEDIVVNKNCGSVK